MFDLQSLLGNRTTGASETTEAAAAAGASKATETTGAAGASETTETTEAATAAGASKATKTTEASETFEANSPIWVAEAIGAIGYLRRGVELLQGVEARLHFGFRSVVSGCPEFTVSYAVRKVLLLHIVSCIIVGIFVSLMVSKFRH